MAKTYIIDQFARFDGFYLGHDYVEDGQPDTGSGYPWKDGRPNIILDDTCLDPDFIDETGTSNGDGINNLGETLASVTTTPSGSILNFAGDMGVGIMETEDEGGILVFGYEDALRTNGARVVRRLDTIEHMLNQQMKLDDALIREKEEYARKVAAVQAAMRLGAKSRRKLEMNPLPQDLLDLLNEENQPYRQNIILGWIDGWTKEDTKREKTQ